ncbi:MAG: efflux transporter outer membrane subunit [Solirubrobacterales bacterium]
MRPFPLVSALVLLAGCSQMPELTMPELSLPVSWGNARPVEAAAPAVPAEVPAAWWSSFGSEELDALEQAALAGNRDLAAAVARIEQAEAQLKVAGAPLLPTLSADALGQVAKRSVTSTSAFSSGRSAVGGGAARTYQGSLSASYEIDFWGKTSSAIAAARAGLDSSRFDRDTVAMTLTAGVASTWFQALALSDRVAVARRNLEIARATMELAERQAEFGKTSALEAAQQRANVAQIEAQLPALELQLAQAVDALAVLTGLAPSRLSLATRSLEGIAAPAVEAGLPSELLRRRPDLRRAEANLQAANANVGVARAQLFPSVELTAERGYASPYLVNLLDPAHIFWTLGASLTGTLFDNGKLSGNVDLAEARVREAAAGYQGAVLTALKDVEDNLAAVGYLAGQEEAQQRAVAAAREAQRLSDVRYREGAVDYLTVLEAQRTLLQTEDAAVQVRLARLNAAVGLFKALGGGLESPP